MMHDPRRRRHANAQEEVDFLLGVGQRAGERDT
jgi:hypothetical protein